MKVITFATHKGGNAKSTLSIHTAIGLALKGYRTILIDTDAQGHSTMHLLGEKIPAMYELLVRSGEWKSLLRSARSQVFPEGYENNQNLAVLGSNDETRNIMGSQGVSFMSLLRRLYELQNRIDFAVIDTSPTPNSLHELVYFASDYVVIPSQMDGFSYDGIISTLLSKEDADPFRTRYQELLSTEVIGIVPVMYEAKTRSDSEGYKTLKKAYGDLIWRPVQKTVRVKEVITRQTSMYRYAPDHPVTHQLWNVVEKIEQKAESDVR